MTSRSALTSLSILVLLAVVPACTSGPRRGSAGNEGTGPDGTTQGFGGRPQETVAELMILLGADRPPSMAFTKLLEVHDTKEWTHPVRIPDASDRCREAVAELRESDYGSWPDTARAVWILSILAGEDPSALVRDDIYGALAWFRSWIHPDDAAMGPGVETDREDRERAKRVLKSLIEEAAPEPDSSQRMVLMDAVAVLASYPWSRLTGSEPAVVRARVPETRGVFAFLLSPGLAGYRRDPVARDALDRALIRMSDHVIFLTELSGLADRTPHVRSAAARALAKSAETSAVPVLASALDREERDDTKLVLIAALADVAPPRGDGNGTAISTLAGRLSEPDPSVRRAAARALARITDADLGDDPALWRKWWRERTGEVEEQ